MIPEAPYSWFRQPKAEKLLFDWMVKALGLNHYLDKFSKELEQKTSTHLFQWIDHFALPQNSENEKQLIEHGFEISQISSPGIVFKHPGALLPEVVLVKPENGFQIGIAIKVDFVADFLMANQISEKIVGSPLSQFRSAQISSINGCSIFIIEKRGTRTFIPTVKEFDFAEKYLCYLEKWQSRPRAHRDQDYAMDQAINLAKEIASEFDPHMAASIVLQAERNHWQCRNTAGWIQKCRQDTLGLGWANHDHHTFRSSRKHYPNLVQIFETVGFHCREKFYAGEQAGWGAQVMENSQTGYALFLDVDLAPGEIDFDISHSKLPEFEKLGTVGLWCALHGDSIFGAGLHHIAGHFAFNDLIKNLQKFNIETMAPFSEFPYLRQAFTNGDIWQISSERLDSLVNTGLITKAQAEDFASKGARGSHLEVLQRGEGFKGFNQQNVSDIITRTDPRKADG